MNNRIIRKEWFKMIIIFGASILGEIAYYVLRSKYEIIAFSDNDAAKHGKIMCDLPIYSPTEIVKFKDIEVIIASRYHMNIGQQLKELGVINVKVFLYKGEAVLADEYREGYRLVPYNMDNFFKNVKVERDKIESIHKDFAINYENAGIMNRNNMSDKSKKILFCAYFFPPLGLGGTQRSLKFVKYLRMFGYEPIVVTVGKDAAHYKRDNSMLEELPEGIEILRFDDEFESIVDLNGKDQQQIFNLYAGTGVGDEWLNKYRDIVMGKDVDYFREVLIPDNNIYWVNNVLKHIENRVSMSEIELIYTTGSPFSSYFLGYYIKQKYNIPWIADYRDPWTSSETQVKYRHKYSERTAVLIKEMEKLLIRSSDSIITVNDDIADGIEKKMKADRKKISVITNGFDEEDFCQIEPEEVKEFTLCYNGQIYNKDDRFNEKNNYTIVLKAINRLIEEGKIEEGKIRWVLSGNIDESVKKILKNIDCYKVVYFNGYLEHRESLKVAMSSNILVHFGFCYDDYIGRNGGAKIYEYFRMMKPILALSKASEEIIEEMECGKNFDYADEEGIGEYILSEYINWSQGNKRVITNEKKIIRYERKNLTKQLAAIFDKCIGEFR